MKELHCEDCKYYKSFKGSFAEAYAVYAELITGFSFHCDKHATEHKTKYGCTYYERRWWKIWV
jgi:hypothetical protein